MGSAEKSVEATVNAVARDSYGRLLSYLAARCGDVELAEDSLGDAFLAALRTWPSRGVPERPEAWLLAAARNRLNDDARRIRVRQQHAERLAHAARDAAAVAESGEGFPDERLKLLFLCADPAIDPDIHTPLMLQVVLRIDAARIARAFLIKPAAMGQRLVRAKTKIRDAGVPFEVPALNELAPRLEAVMEAIYAAYSSGWEDAPGTDPGQARLTEEALWLARVLVELMPDEPEPRGLFALLLHCEARRSARRSSEGRYVPIAEQDPALWSVDLMREAERHLRAASAQQRLGRFQLEAAIQSVHAERARTGRIDRRAIALLYEGLVRTAPTLGALVGRAAATAEVDGPEAGLAMLEEIRGHPMEEHQPYWAVRAHLLAQAGRAGEARDAFARAIDLTDDDAVRVFLIERSEAVETDQR